MAKVPKKRKKQNKKKPQSTKSQQNKHNKKVNPKSKRQKKKQEKISQAREAEAAKNSSNASDAAKNASKAADAAADVVEEVVEDAAGRKKGILDHIFRRDPERGLMLTKKAVAGIVVGSSAISVKRGVEDSIDAKTGRLNSMPELVRATPRISSYANNAGATGDINFALHANRRG